MCVPNFEYQFINPTTQAAFFSVCIGNCTTAQNITWNIYQGSLNPTSNIMQWTLFNQMDLYRNIWFFDTDIHFFLASNALFLGADTSNLTATNKLFINHPHVTYWRFQVIYSFPSGSSSSALNFIINQPPQNGFCSITPTIGTTSTLFTISCFNWTDKDGIKDYLFYGIF